MPRGILSTFIINIHDCIVEGKQWKHGVIIQRNGAHALVHEDSAQKYIHIYITGQNKRDFLAVIADELQKIHKELNDLPHQGKLACHCPVCAKQPEPPHYFPFSLILRALAKGQPLSLLCEQSLEHIAIRQLMGEVIAPHQQYESDSTKNIYHLYGGNIMNDSNQFQGNVTAKVIGSVETYNENNQNNGIQTIVENSTVNGDINVEGNTIINHGQNIAVDTEALATELTKLAAFLGQKIAQNPNDTSVSSALMAVMPAKNALNSGDDAKAIAW